MTQLNEGDKCASDKGLQEMRRGERECQGESGESEWKREGIRREWIFPLLSPSSSSSLCSFLIIIIWIPVSRDNSPQENNIIFRRTGVNDSSLHDYVNDPLMIIHLTSDSPSILGSEWKRDGHEYMPCLIQDGIMAHQPLRIWLLTPRIDSRLLLKLLIGLNVFLALYFIFSMGPGAQKTPCVVVINSNNNALGATRHNQQNHPNNNNHPSEDAVVSVMLNVHHVSIIQWLKSNNWQ